MSNHAPHNGSADTPEEELVVINVAIGALGTVLASAGILWFKGVAWLLEHKIIVPEAAAPLITIPGTHGAGLDLPRTALAAAILLAVLTLTVSAGHRAITRSRRREDFA